MTIPHPVPIAEYVDFGTSSSSPVAAGYTRVTAAAVGLIALVNG